MKKLMGGIESYGFECEAGPLTNCADWKKLKEVGSELRAMLEELEFCDEAEAMGEVRKFCPICTTLEGHDEDCKLGKLLQRVRGEQ